jgi:hypothetical protein
MSRADDVHVVRNSRRVLDSRDYPPDEAWTALQEVVERLLEEAARAEDVATELAIEKAQLESRQRDAGEQLIEAIQAAHDVMLELCPRGFPIKREEHTNAQWQSKMAYHFIHEAAKALAGRPDRAVQAASSTDSS